MTTDEARRYAIGAALRRNLPMLCDEALDAWYSVFGLPALIRLDDDTYMPSADWLEQAVALLTEHKAP